MSVQNAIVFVLRVHVLYIPSSLLTLFTDLSSEWINRDPDHINVFAFLCWCVSEHVCSKDLCFVSWWRFALLLLIIVPVSEHIRHTWSACGNNNKKIKKDSWLKALAKRSAFLLFRPKKIISFLIILIIFGSLSGVCGPVGRILPWTCNNYLLAIYHNKIMINKLRLYLWWILLCVHLHLDVLTATRDNGAAICLWITFLFFFWWRNGQML